MSIKKECIYKCCENEVQYARPPTYLLLLYNLANIKCEKCSEVFRGTHEYKIHVCKAKENAQPSSIRELANILKNLELQSEKIDEKTSEL